MHGPATPPDDVCEPVAPTKSVSAAEAGHTRKDASVQVQLDGLSDWREADAERRSQLASLIEADDLGNVVDLTPTGETPKPNANDEDMSTYEDLDFETRLKVLKARLKSRRIVRDNRPPTPLDKRDLYFDCDGR